MLKLEVLVGIKEFVSGCGLVPYADMAVGCWMNKIWFPF